MIRGKNRFLRNTGRWLHLNGATLLVLALVGALFGMGFLSAMAGGAR